MAMQCGCDCSITAGRPLSQAPLSQELEEEKTKAAQLEQMLQDQRDAEYREMKLQLIKAQAFSKEMDSMKMKVGLPLIAV